jgi:hypothetical protein
MNDKYNPGIAICNRICNVRVSGSKFILIGFNPPVRSGTTIRYTLAIVYGHA